jgi:lipoprotein-releasing system permease protein
VKLPLFIAGRYLVSKRKKNFINIISAISVIAVAIITAAIIVVLSVFNGIGSILHTLNNSFDPEIKIEAVKGKSFHATDSLLNSISQVQGVKIVTEVIEDYAYIRYGDANQIVKMKGVSENFIYQDRLPKESIVDGELKLTQNGIPHAIVGSGIKTSLSIDATSDMFAIQVYYIKNTRSLDPSQMYTHKNILPGGVFSIMQSFDDSYIIVPLDFAKDLLDYGDKRTSLEIKVTDLKSLASTQAELQGVLGKNYRVLNQEEQHEDLYRLLKMEKLFVFLALSILLAIGSINIFFSLMMLALDKKKDISVLTAMGANDTLIRKIFLAEGAMIACTGTLLGLILGGLLCWVQIEFGLISMGMETSVTDGYPIKVEWTDFTLTLLVVGIVTFLISLRPASLAVKTSSVRHL